MMWRGQSRLIATARAIAVRAGCVPALGGWGRVGPGPVPDRNDSRAGSTPDRPNPRRPGAFGAAHEDPADAYAGVPILQQPKWHNEIVGYFFFGGISSGAAILGSLAGLSGDRWQPLARTAHVVSLAAAIPCAPLLIVELGRPSRFHHMMRIFKPSSPMNLGAWTLLAHSGFSALLAAQALAASDRLPVAGDLARRLPSRALGAAGLLPSLTLGGYTGVLLGTTSVPLWSQSPMLGGLFMASGVATGTSAVSLASAVTDSDTPSDHAALGTIAIAAGAAELWLLAGYLITSGPAAKPLLRGTNGALLAGAAAASVAAVALELAGALLPARRRIFGTIAASATLASGAMLRWAVVHAGHDSALDRDANLDAMRPTPDNPGWGPPITDAGPA